MIKSSVELWRELSTIAEFEDVAYDEELKNTIARSLHLAPDRIANGLHEKSIPVERLLTVFLDALKPFSSMMGDLLRTYELAGAKSNNNNIKIEFDFDSVPKQYGLEAFKNYVSIVQERTDVKTKLRSPWLLLQYLGRFDHGSLNHKKNRSYPREIQKWLDAYNNDILPEHLPPFPIIRYNKGLSDILSIVEESLQRYRTEYDPSKGLYKSLRIARDKYDTNFWWAESDHWLGRFVEIFYEITSYYHNSLKGISESETAYYESILHDMNVVEIVTEKEKYDAICEILDMPFWKHRYEMYSAWVFTCIVDSFADLGISYNVVDRVLQFKFSGALLATLSVFDVQFEIWDEKRFEADNLTGKGRKKHIQPDYSIIQKGAESDVSCVLIECKQYKRPKNKNFADAINDYARACSDAKVFLVNYGCISKNLTAKIGIDVRRRYNCYGKMQPFTIQREDFIWNLREYIEAVWTEDQIKNNRELIVWEDRPEQLKVSLTWGCSPCDLDLIAMMRMPSDKEDYRIDYNNMGSESEFPYAFLDDDTRKGPGKETFLVKDIISGCYDIYVSNYSGEDEIDGEIKIRISSGQQSIIIAKKGIWKRGCLWHVGFLNSIGFINVDEWDWNKRIR